MNYIQKTVSLIPEIQDQVDLFNEAFYQETVLSDVDKKIVVWAAAVACKNSSLVEFVKDEVGDLSASDKKLVLTANSRMAITNPYFMSRNVHPLQAGGTLSALKMRPFQNLNIENEQGYHFACVAISLINNGFVCFNSHVSSLKNSSQSDAAIDQSVRLTASISAMNQLLFNESILR